MSDTRTDVGGETTFGPERALREQRDLYETLLRSMSELGEGLLIARDGRCVYANEAYLRLSGYSLDELKAMPSLLDLAPEEERATTVMRMQVRRRGGNAPQHYESAMLRKDGTRIQLEVAHHEMIGADGPQNVTIVRDITSRKREERQLAQLNASRATFIANAAHELRTPVTVIRGIAAILGTPAVDTADEKTAAMFAALRRQSERLTELVERLLEMTEVELLGGMDLSPVCLDDAVRSGLKAVPPPPERTVDVRVDPRIRVLADGDRLAQALGNVLANAYAFAERVVRIDGVLEGATVLLSVTDDGSGVPAGFVPSLFYPFARTSDEGRVKGGGLGLAITRGIIEQLDGEIWYEPGSPRGATFRMRLPAA